MNPNDLFTKAGDNKPEFNSLEDKVIYERLLNWSKSINEHYKWTIDQTWLSTMTIKGVQYPLLRIKIKDISYGDVLYEISTIPGGLKPESSRFWIYRSPESKYYWAPLSVFTNSSSIKDINKQLLILFIRGGDDRIRALYNLSSNSLSSPENEEVDETIISLSHFKKFPFSLDNIINKKQ